MEALTAASVAALTVYDMVKGVERGVEIRVDPSLSKTGGKSGEWASRRADGAGRRRLAAEPRPATAAARPAGSPAIAAQAACRDRTDGAMPRHRAARSC